MELRHGQVQFELPVRWKLHCTHGNQNGVRVRDLSLDPRKSDWMKVSLGSFTDEKFRWMETHRCIFPLYVQFMFIIKWSYKMGTVMFKSGIGRFLQIYNTYNVCPPPKKMWLGFKKHLICENHNPSALHWGLYIQASGMTHSKFILNKTAVDFRFNPKMKNTDKNAVYCILYFYRV